MQQGLNKAIKLANTTYQKVPAYRKILKNLGVKNKIRSAQDFFCLPVLDKKNYINTSDFFNLIPITDFPAVIHASSGSSGKPTFWPSGHKQTIVGGKIHEIIFRDIFGIKKNEPTLVIVCFSMGVWVAGGFTKSACMELNKKGFKLSVITPGIEKNDIFYILNELAPKFENVILAGYPPFIMDILNQSRTDNVKLPKNLKILTAGDSFTEDFRDKLLNLTGNTKPSSVISLYGSADAGPMAFETPLSIFLRRQLKNNLELQKIIGTSVPAFFQYIPEQIFFENSGEELIITTNSGAPLIRYSIHDTGKVFQNQDFNTILKTKEVSSLGLNKWQKLPFVSKSGRTDVAVTFYALNIYPENILAGIQHKSVKKFLSGNYVSYNKNTRGQTKHELHIALELKSNISIKNSHKNKIEKVITNTLVEHNAEYRKLKSILGDKANPKIHLFSQDNILFRKIKGLRYTLGKKAKISL